MTWFRNRWFLFSEAITRFQNRSFASFYYLGEIHKFYQLKTNFNIIAFVSHAKTLDS